MSEEEEEEVDVKLENVNVDEIIYTEKIRGNNRIYVNNLTLAECVQVVCVRADQIEKGAMIFVTMTNAHAYEIAVKEILEGECPLSILRSRGRKGNIEYVEEWTVNELQKSEKLVDKIQNIFDRSENYNIRNKLESLRN